MSDTSDHETQRRLKANNASLRDREYAKRQAARWLSLLSDQEVAEVVLDSTGKLIRAWRKPTPLSVLPFEELAPYFLVNDKGPGLWARTARSKWHFLSPAYSIFNALNLSYTLCRKAPFHGSSISLARNPEGRCKKCNTTLEKLGSELFNRVEWGGPSDLEEYLHCPPPVFLEVPTYLSATSDTL